MSKLQKIQCPSCEERGKIKLVAKFINGVCAECFSRFSSHPQIVGGYGVTRKIDHDAGGYIDNHFEGICYFPFDEIKGEIGEDLTRNEKALAASAVCKFARTLLQLKASRARDIQKVLAVLLFASGLHPEQHLSGEEIAKRYGITRQAFFNRVNEIRDTMSLPPVPGAKKKEARDTYKISAKKGWEKRKQ